MTNCFIQALSGKIELVALADPDVDGSGRKLAHFTRNEDPACSWSPKSLTLNDIPAAAVVSKNCTGPAAIIESDVNSLEVLALNGTEVTHHSLEPSHSDSGWTTKDEAISSSATGAPSFIQSSYNLTSGHGNFEAVILEGSNLVHYYRDNTTSIWHRALTITNRATGPGCIVQSTYGTSNGGHGSFEVVVPEDDGKLAHYYRANSSEETTGEGWKLAQYVSMRAAGPASFIQTKPKAEGAKAGKQGNFEAVFAEYEPKSRDGKAYLVHYYHDNANSQSWMTTGKVSETPVVPGSAPTLVQGAGGNLEVVFLEAGEGKERLVHKWRDGNRWVEGEVIATFENGKGTH